MPDHLDAALALPAQNFLAGERVYFFKGARGGRGGAPAERRAGPGEGEPASGARCPRA